MEVIPAIDLKNGRCVRLPGVSHWVQQEAPETVNAILAGWLNAPRPR